jgi:hypothetical protein
MGVSDSIALKPHFKDISSFPWSRVKDILGTYKSQGYDFGIDYTAIMNLMACTQERAQDLIQSHSINDVGV